MKTILFKIPTGNSFKCWRNASFRCQSSRQKFPVLMAVRYVYIYRDIHINLNATFVKRIMKYKVCVRNTGPLVFSAPLVGSPPSIVCPSPVSRSFRESISRRTVMLAQWQGITKQTLPELSNHLVSQSTPDAQYGEVKKSVTHIHCFRCKGFQTRARFGQKVREDCFVRGEVTWNPANTSKKKNTFRNLSLILISA